MKISKKQLREMIMKEVDQEFSRDVAYQRMKSEREKEKNIILAHEDELEKAARGARIATKIISDILKGETQIAFKSERGSKIVTNSRGALTAAFVKLQYAIKVINKIHQEM